MQAPSLARDESGSEQQAGHFVSEAIQFGRADLEAALEELALDFDHPVLEFAGQALGPLQQRQGFRVVAGRQVVGVLDAKALAHQGKGGPFAGIDQLVADFLSDVTRWRDEHGNA